MSKMNHLDGKMKIIFGKKMADHYTGGSKSKITIKNNIIKMKKGKNLQNILLFVNVCIYVTEPEISKF